MPALGMTEGTIASRPMRIPDCRWRPLRTALGVKINKSFFKPLSAKRWNTVKEKCQNFMMLNLVAAQNECQEEDHQCQSDRYISGPKFHDITTFSIPRQLPNPAAYELSGSNPSSNSVFILLGPTLACTRLTPFAICDSRQGGASIKVEGFVSWPKHYRCPPSNLLPFLPSVLELSRSLKP